MDEIIIRERGERDVKGEKSVKTGTMAEVHDRERETNNNFMCFPL